jgi:hypothetical protein
MRMLREDAAAVGAIVEDAFQGKGEVDDDHLDKDLRQVFYSLQDEKVLDVRREERLDERGQAKRYYLWRVREDEVAAAPERAGPSPEEKLYLRMRDDQWERRPLDIDVA